ncbi:hypothetical protein [Streptomyces sp. NPDC091212]|uniref:hypothetical protein n=1 Tax=Streptomyces sp. NPDC091212 TaxID=3155191 RepID=UPI003447E359
MPADMMRTWNPVDRKTGTPVAQWGAAELATMTAGEIAEATEAGHFNNYVLGPEPEPAAGVTDAPEQLGAGDAARMSDAEIAAATRAGQFTEYMNSKTPLPPEDAS